MNYFKRKENILEPITGMDIPFSSLVGTSSVGRVASNTGGFGGVMLQQIIGI